MKGKLPFIVLLTLITALYPLFVYFSINRFGATVISLLLLALLLLRLLASRDLRQPMLLPLLIPVCILCLLAAVQQSEALLRYYPAAMNLAFALFFLLSLRSSTPLVETLAKKFLTDIQAHQKRYMRNLTIAWALFLGFNTLVASFTACCSSFSFWALYNGLISYLLIVLFFIAELVFRHFYKKRYYQHG